ncbi:hypothetical protein HAX54_025987, partial [Datura stramonium]|nr:hypothetical protein [Datura stramonium]
RFDHDQSSYETTSSSLSYHLCFTPSSNAVQQVHTTDDYTTLASCSIHPLSQNNLRPLTRLRNKRFTMTVGSSEQVVARLVVSRRLGGGLK